MCQMMLERARKVYDMHKDGHKLIFHKRFIDGNTTLVDTLEDADIVSIADSPISCPKDLFCSLLEPHCANKFNPLADIPM